MIFIVLSAAFIFISLIVGLVVVTTTVPISNLKQKKPLLALLFFLLILGMSLATWTDNQKTHLIITYKTVTQIDLHSANADSKGIVHFKDPLKIRITKVVHNDVMFSDLNYIKDITIMNNDHDGKK